jgi:hypothetical protein
MPLRQLTPDERPAQPAPEPAGYTPMRIPNAGEVMLPADTRFAPISPAVFDRHRDWSGPVRVRLRPRRDGLIDVEIREDR